MTHSLSKSDLNQFTGTEQWYRHPLARNVLYTDGAHFVAANGGAYWLLDEITFAQTIPTVSREPFQVWKLSVHADHTATLTCDDGNGHKVLSKNIPYTDFPLNEIEIWFCDSVILLPSEY